MEKYLGLVFSLDAGADTAAIDVDVTRKADGKVRRGKSDRRDDAARLRDFILLSHEDTSQFWERKGRMGGNLFGLLKTPR